MKTLVAVIASKAKQSNPSIRRMAWLDCRVAALLAMTIFVLPSAAVATKLTVCDGKSYDVTVINGGQSRVAHLTPSNGEIEEFGPVISLQIAGHPPVVITEQFDEYCIWKGKITLQRRNPGNDANGGFDAR